jgi:hypothetical protein
LAEIARWFRTVQEYKRVPYSGDYTRLPHAVFCHFLHLTGLRMYSFRTQMCYCKADCTKESILRTQVSFPHISPNTPAINV